MNIHTSIIQTVQDAVKELYQSEIEATQINLQDTRKEFDGEITLVVFPITRFSKKSPEQTAQEVGNYLQSNLSLIANFNVVKGFLNVSIAQTYWIETFNQSILKENFGQFAPKNEKVMLEYSSPNTNKPLHLGHVRNNLLGYSVAELLKANGYDVTKVNLINDRGIHICKSMLAWQKFGAGETPQNTGLKGDHLVGKYYVIFDKEYKKQIDELTAQGQSVDEAKKNAPLILEAQKMLQDWEANVPEVVALWKKMNGWVYEGFKMSYKKLGVDFDKYYYESNTYLLGKDIVNEGLEKNVFYKKPDGSVWIDLTADGLDEKLVLRADGTSVYITQDLGTAQMKYDDCGMDQSIYVVGNEQDYHFKVLFKILEKLGKPWAKGMYHLSYGMVDLPSGKMKSREGTVVDADDLIDEMIATARQKTLELGKVDDFSEEEREVLYQTIGLGALKYFLLKVEPKKRLLFDPKESIDFQGHTGPFIQYAYARIQSILRKAQHQHLPSEVTILSAIESEIIRLMIKFPNELNAAAQNFSPALMANYLYEIAKTFNKFYHEEPVLKLKDIHLKQHRLNICYATALIIQKGMQLLGISVPERM